LPALASRCAGARPATDQYRARNDDQGTRKIMQAAAATTTLLPPGLWQVDPESSRIGFAVRKLGSGLVHGQFREFAGSILIDGHGSTAFGIVAVASIDTGHEGRDAHLRGFFAAQTYPEIELHHARTSRTREGGWCVTGDLKIRGRTRAIQLTVTEAAGTRLCLRGEIDRRDFGLVWTRAVEVSGVVSTKIQIELDLEFHRAPAGPHA
jgi:polyisoprenoid-binding protein YceI